METVRTKEKAIKSMQLISLTAVALLVFSNILWAWFYHSGLQEATKTSFVTTDMGSFMVTRNPDNELQQYEVGNFADRFLTLLLQYDGATLESNLRLSLEWTNEETRKKIFDDYIKGGVLDNLRSTDSKTEFLLDSVKVDLNVRPAVAYVYGKQTTIYKTQRSTKPVGAKLTISQVSSARKSRTPKNPWGMIVTNVSFFAYNPVEVKRDEPTDTLQAPIITKQEIQ